MIKSFKPSLISDIISEQIKAKEEELDNVWDADKVAEAEEMMVKRNQQHPLGNPYYDTRNIGKMRRADVTYKMNDWEISEFRKCARDIIYFAETYCKIKTEEGHYTNFKLRPYQIEFLKLSRDNNYCIYLASRQIGKCLIPQTLTEIKSPNGNIEVMSLNDMYDMFKMETTVLQKIKKWLWKIYTKI